MQTQDNLTICSDLTIGQTSIPVRINSLLEQFDISVNGFLPAEPIKKLSSNIPWENIADVLSTEKNNPTFRKCVESLPDFDLSQLTMPNDYKRAYVILTLITNCYVFGLNPIAQSIPKKLAIPLWHVSQYLRINPILTHAAVDLYNWHLADESGPIVLDNLRSTNLITGTEDEERFYLVMVAIEKVGSQIIRDLVEIHYVNTDKSIDSTDLPSEQILRLLNNIDQCLHEIIAVLKRMGEKCKPDVFFNVLRPYLKGWENNDDIPNGMIYEGVADTPMSFCGGSAAQCSLFQVLDAAFAIVHKSEYFKSIRAYMPGKHQDFITYIEQTINLKHIISDFASDLNYSKLLNVYTNCVESIGLFRSCHMNLVHKYILQQTKADPTDLTDAKGTGGTSLVTFLNEAITETYDRAK